MLSGYKRTETAETFIKAGCFKVNNFWLINVLMFRESPAGLEYD